MLSKHTSGSIKTECKATRSRPPRFVVQRLHLLSLISAPHFPRRTSASRPAPQHAAWRSSGGARRVRVSAWSNEITLTSRLLITAANRQQQSSSRPENKQADVITHRRGHAASTSHVVSRTRRWTRRTARTHVRNWLSQTRWRRFDAGKGF